MEPRKKSKVLLANFEKSPELAEVKVVYKSINKSKIQIKSSEDAFNVVFQLFDQDIIEYQEQFFLVLLSRFHTVIGWIKISQGGTSSTVVDPKIIFTLALKTNASLIILGHNHPSGNINPSTEDITLTRTIFEIGKLLGIDLLDHIILSPEKMYYSFADEGQLK